MNYKQLLLASTLSIALAGCADLHMRTPSAAPDSVEEALLTGIGHKDSGRFQLAGAEGTFVRGNVTIRAEPALIHEGDAQFTLSGEGVDGDVRAECGYIAVDSGDAVLAVRTQPLVYRCSFFRDGQPIDARLEVKEKRSLGDKREGLLFYRGRRMDLTSVHDSPQLRIPAGSALGYMFIVDGREVGGIDSNATPRRAFLPRDPALREAAMVASVALALFRDVSWTDFDKEPDIEVF